MLYLCKQSMGNYRMSNGDKVSKSVIDSRTREAKRLVLSIQFDEYGYNFCEICTRSGGVRLDCSHTISVDKAQKTGRSELAWSLGNIRVLCRECHQKHDKLY